MHGKPLGYCGRRLSRSEITRWGKWCFPRQFPKQEVLYNAHRALDYRDSGIVVVECPWAVMRLYQAGISGTVALLGTQLHKRAKDWLCYSKQILLILDGDDAGRKASGRIGRDLSGFVPVRMHLLPDGKEPEDLSDEELKTIVSHYLDGYA
jgi:DNA primase